MGRVVCGFPLEDGPVLVTGAGGFAGRFVMERFGLGSGDFASDLSADFQAPAGVERIAWSLPGPAPASLGPVRYVIHLAGLSSVARSSQGSAPVIEVNAKGTRSVADWLEAACPGARILLASSAEVYRPSGEALTEDSSLEPRSPYGESKLMAERILAERDIDWVISRSFPHFGPWQQAHFVLPSFCRRIIRAVREGIAEIPVGNLQAVRDYLYVEDVVKAYASLLSRGRRGGIYNVCSGRGHSIGEMLELLMKISGSRVKAVTDPGLLRGSDQFRQVGDPTKLEDLGWRAEVQLEDGLRMLYSWWEERT